MLHDAGAGGLLIPDNASAPRVCDLHGRQLETASLAGDSRIVRHTAILDVIADAVPGSRTEPAHLLAHVLPQLVGRQVRQGLRPDMTARTAHGQPPRHAARADRHAVWYDVKQLTAACTSSYLSGPGARSFAPGAVADRRAELVHREAVRAVRALDSTHSHLPGGGGVMYPSLQEQEERGLDGPVYRAFRAAVGEADGGVVQGLVVGSYGDTSAAVDALAGEAADDMAGRHWRLMGARSQAEARGIFMQYVRRRWSATFWRSWRTLLHSRLPCVGQPSSSMLRVGAPAPVPAAPWLGDYPAARADAGVAHGAAAARGHA